MARYADSVTNEHRIMSQVDKSDSGCWLWTGMKTINGYGRLKYLGRPASAHRFSYKTFKGEIPCGRLVCHKCDVRLCVNPDHLFLGSHKENMNDMVLKKRSAVAKNCKAKLKPCHVKEILRQKKQYYKYYSASELASVYRVSRSTIHRVLSGESWNIFT